AIRGKGAPGEVEVIAPESLPELRASRADLDQIGAAPRPAQRDVGIPEQQAHVGRYERLAVGAWLSLLDEAHARRVAGGEPRAGRARAAGRGRDSPRGGAGAGGGAGAAAAAIASTATTAWNLNPSFGLRELTMKPAT